MWGKELLIIKPIIENSRIIKWQFEFDTKPPNKNKIKIYRIFKKSIKHLYETSVERNRKLRKKN